MGFETDADIGDVRFVQSRSIHIGELLLFYGGSPLIPVRCMSPSVVNISLFHVLPKDFLSK